MSAASIMKELRRIERDIYRQVRDALVDEAESIMERSKNEFVPEDTGALRDSGQVTVIEEGGKLDNLEVILSYGDEKTNDYALSLHEYPSEHDPPSWEGVSVNFDKGGPKYLERPLFDAEDGLIERIAAKVKL